MEDKVIIEENYDLEKFDNIKRFFSDEDFDIVFFHKGREVQRIIGIPLNEIDRYVFADPTTIIEDAKEGGL